MKQGLFEIMENRPLTSDVMRIRLKGDCSAIKKPGQFVDIKIEGLFLRRPLSVCDCEDGVITLVYKVLGSGTEKLSKIQSGSLDLLTGLGNGFDPFPESSPCSSPGVWASRRCTFWQRH